MNTSDFDRRNYIAAPTPIEHLPRLSRLLDCGINIYVKRDDTLSLGGSKTRALEFIMADVLNGGADCVVTCGRVQSNHCRITLEACIKEELPCYLVIEELISHSYDPHASGNNYLYHLLGAERIVRVSAGELKVGMQLLAKQLREEGKHPYIIPAGGASATGALGYTACAGEITEQQKQHGLPDFDAIIVPSGSGGTHAGLLVGLRALENPIRIIGVSVENDTANQTARVAGVVVSLSAKLHLDPSEVVNEIEVLDDYVGNGYSLPTLRTNEAIKLFARNEAILLDPVYSGKAGAALIDLIRRGAFIRGSNVLLIHTGGVASLFHFMPL